MKLNYFEAESLKDALYQIYTRNRFDGDNRPETTIDKFIEAIGADRAKALIQGMIAYIDGFDGRIDRAVYQWAAGADKVVPDDRIHRSHLNQLARAMMTR